MLCRPRLLPLLPQHYSPLILIRACRRRRIPYGRLRLRPRPLSSHCFLFPRLRNHAHPGLPFPRRHRLLPHISLRCPHRMARHFRGFHPRASSNLSNYVREQNPGGRDESALRTMRQNSHRPVDDKWTRWLRGLKKTCNTLEPRARGMSNNCALMFIREAEACCSASKRLTRKYRRTAIKPSSTSKQERQAARFNCPGSLSLKYTF